MKRRRLTFVGLALVLLFVTTANHPGNIGSCGQAPDDLDAIRFFTAKEEIDCDKCRACELTSDACTHACEPALDISTFPPSCYPLVHDGEVCLNKLKASGCASYRQFMSDLAPTIPTECNFCPPCNDGGLPDGSPSLPQCE